MSGLINGLFGDPAAQTAAAQHSAQQGAEQFSAQQLQQIMAQQQQARQQAMQALQGFLQQNPNPAQGWGSIVGPQNTAPQSIGGGIMGGANGSPQGPIGAQQLGQMPQGDPNMLRILSQILGAKQNPQQPAPFQLAPTPPPLQTPQAPVSPPFAGGHFGGNVPRFGMRPPMETM